MPGATPNGRKAWNPDVLQGSQLPVRRAAQIWPKMEWPPGEFHVPTPDELSFHLRDYRQRPGKGVHLKDVIPGLNKLPVSVTPEMRDVLVGAARRVHLKRMADIDRRGRLAAGRIRDLQRMEFEKRTPGGPGGQGMGMGQRRPRPRAHVPLGTGALNPKPGTAEAMKLAAGLVAEPAKAAVEAIRLREAQRREAARAAAAEKVAFEAAQRKTKLRLRGGLVGAVFLDNAVVEHGDAAAGGERLSARTGSGSGSGSGSGDDGLDRFRSGGGRPPGTAPSGGRRSGSPGSVYSHGSGADDGGLLYEGGRRGSDASSAYTTPYQREWMKWRARDEPVPHIPALGAAARSRMRDMQVEEEHRQRKEMWRVQTIESKAVAKKLAQEMAKADSFQRY